MLERSGPGRWLSASRYVKYWVSMRLRLSRLVDQPVRFLVCEITWSRRTATYRLRGSGACFAVRHNSPDIVVAEEIFLRGLYEPPAQVEVALSSTGDDLSVLDLGGNIGLFGTWLVNRGGFAALEAFEPDAGNAALHARTIACNGRGSSWTVVEAAAGNVDGTASFAGDDFAVSHVVDDGAAEATTTVTMVDVLPRCARVDLIKMDIEGGEWAILQDPRFAECTFRALAFEYHPDNCPEPDTHDAARRLIEAAGLAFLPVFQGDDGVGMAWGWRPGA